MQQPVFSEQQRFRQPALWALFAFLGAALGLFLYGIREQIFLHRRFGDKPAPDIVLILGALVLLALLAGLFAARLETVYTAETIRYRWFPFKVKHTEVRWENVAAADVFNYGNVWGYGYRFTPEGTVHSVAGRMGLRLKMNSGKTLVLGTQKPAELQAFLEKLGVEAVMQQK